MMENKNGETATGLLNMADPSTKSNNNVYTPPLATSGSSSNHPSLLDSPIKDAKIPFEKEKSMPQLVSLNKQTNRHFCKLPVENSRGKRSTVRPFLCCGSEASLVSLVDGLDLNDDNSKEKKTSIECSSSSNEQRTLGSFLSRQGSTISRHSSFCRGEHSLGDTVLRRKRRKDKHRVTKKPWSQRLRGQWNCRWRICQQQRAAAQFDLPHRALGSSDVQQVAGLSGFDQKLPKCRALSVSSHMIDPPHMTDFDRLYPVDDIDAIQIKGRAIEMAAGVEVGPVSLTRAYFPHRAFSGSPQHSSLFGSVELSLLPMHSTPPSMNDAVWQWQQSRDNSPVDQVMFSSPRIHTQVDFIHCLVPQQARILSCPFYWGVMDRYEAERLLDNKPEGTFLLRDSAQEDFLFSVSFRRYNRSLHARVEQWNHRFSFDAHDPAVFSAPSVCELLQHFKDPTCCMFFEPLLTRPLPRNFPFSLQHICRAVICDCISYDQIQSLPLPNSMKQFLQAYHYKQKVRVRHFDGPGVGYDPTDMILYSVD